MSRLLLHCSVISLIILCAPNSHAHEGPHPHVHSKSHGHDDAGKFFTTRKSSRVLPLAKEEDVFHFVVYGDRTGGVPAGLKVLEQAVIDTNLLDPDLVMTVGDLIQGYNDAPLWMEQMAEYKEIMDRLKMQWFPVAGNHDVYWRGEGKAPQGQHETNYEKHFGPLWYTFQHKNAGFVVLYSDEGDSATNEKGFNEGRLQKMSPEQLDFLRQSLEKHKDLEHVFLFLHHPRWIGAGYTDGNWDEVHGILKSAGNVSAVFAGHIHHMRFDGPKDGIAYYTLATTGGHLSADIPEAGYLHHLNVVTVRKESVTVAALPVGSVIDPTEFTPEFLADVDKARKIRPVEVDNNLMLQIDGSASGELTFSLTNTSAQPIEATASLDPVNRDWTTTLDHQHVTIEAGKTLQLSFGLQRKADLQAELTNPRILMDLHYVGQSTRINLPPTSTPISMKLAAVPADYFSGSENRCLNVVDERSAVRVDSSELKLPNGPFTLEAWVNPVQAAGHRGLIAKTQQSEFAFFMDEGVPQFDVNLKGKYYSAKATDVLPVNQWSHLAGVYDGSEVKLYINGALAGSKKATGKRTTNKLPLFIGADPDTQGQATRPFLGKIDEVRVSKKAIYTSDFKAERRLAAGTDTVLMLHLDRQFGPFVLDQSTSAAKGTLGVNAKLVPVR
ncbi:LamG-like jellyroll fold domain-containing protein [Novipirellula sp.]|uniref:LamG-like jellyroll fold domain-containing protein n=1 Tax=Novipirellula sp. TaxID=2795430 RepID=UPI0035688A0F